MTSLIKSIDKKNKRGTIQTVKGGEKMKLRDLTGQTFGRLTVVERVKNDKYKDAYWLCRCICGNEVVVRGTCLTKGEIQSCGCLQKERTVQANTKHGMTESKIYHTWRDIKDRCYNKNSKDYPRYGGRGITMFEDWKENFQAFYDYVSMLENYGEKNYSLDRIENNGNYEPGNVRWATKKQQANNMRRNVKVIYNGEEMCLMDASEKSGIPHYVLRNRIKAGDSGDELFRPVEPKGGYKNVQKNRQRVINGYIAAFDT